MHSSTVKLQAFERWEALVTGGNWTLVAVVDVRAQVFVVACFRAKSLAAV